MTLEERVARLENFTGNIEKIKSVYANSVQEICDKYLNLLYIETPEVGFTNRLVLDGFLSDLTSKAAVPHNVAFNVRPSHDFKIQDNPGEGDGVSRLILKRDETRLEFPLKKYSTTTPGTLVYLEEGDYKQGLLYSIYIDSQDIAIISSSDAGRIALNAVEELTDIVEDLTTKMASLVNQQGEVTISDAAIDYLTVSQSLTLSNAISLPLGSTCSTPTSSSAAGVIANKGYVDSQITAKIQEWYNTHHIFDTIEPSIALQDAPEKAIYYKYE